MPRVKARVTITANPKSHHSRFSILCNGSGRVLGRLGTSATVVGFMAAGSPPSLSEPPAEWLVESRPPSSVLREFRVDRTRRVKTLSIRATTQNFGASGYATITPDSGTTSQRYVSYGG